MKHFFMLLLLAQTFVACNPKNSNAGYDALPELPDEIFSELDTTRMATVISDVIVLPARDSMPGIALAPCCGIKIDRSLQVTMTYTKCGPLLDFIMADIDNMEVAERRIDQPTTGIDTTSSGKATMYKLSQSRSSRFLQTICVTSSGPWNANLTETRACNGYNPHYSLIIMPHGNAIVKQWVGGIENHPPDIGLVSCRVLSTLETHCGGPSTCQCRSSVCQATEPCNCGIDGEW